MNVNLNRTIPATRAKLTLVAAFAIGLAALPASGVQAGSAGAKTQAAPLDQSTDVSARRKVRRTAYKSRRARHVHVRHAHVRHGRVRHARRAGVVQSGGNREASISSELRALIADLRSKHGADSVRVISGRDSRGYSKSCHPLGQAFDAHVSRAVMADLRSRHFGLITYSGGMHHVHVSSCAREAGLRAHKTIGSRNIYAKYMGRMKRGG